MFELYIQALLLGNTCHMHQTRAVGTGYESCTSLHVALHFIETHLLANGRLLNREHAAKTATFVGALWL